MSKKDNFNKELTYIKNEDIKEDLIKMINLVPEYFFEVPASSSGKYHPEFSLGRGGLLRHTKFAVRIAYDLLNTEMYTEKFNDREKDLIIYALIMHDTFKHGLIKEEYTRFDHPIISGEFVSNNSNLLEKDVISSMIKSHMGQWNYDKYKNITLPKPKTECERFVHMCDYLSSKRYLNSKFIGNEIDEAIKEAIC